MSAMRENIHRSLDVFTCCNSPYGIITYTKDMIPGMMLGPWSPSLAKVILVPSFHPGLTLMVSIFSFILVVWLSLFIT